ncbi:hypothetical protein RR47_GL002277 [Enterococcus columbae DSM 7374 = ATCC 51263]|nr:hypothetical protein RR47_GL002277 [Enterococcus columbae DSM 7374 = ATCC 51263]
MKIFMKTKEEFTNLLQSLQAGEIQEIIVKHDEFFSFREAWLVLENRNDVVGEAGLNGEIIYRMKD